MVVPDGNPNAEVHGWDDEDVIEYYEDLMDVIRYGEPEMVTARDKRDFDRLQAELISRIAKEVLDYEETHANGDTSEDG